MSLAEHKHKVSREFQHMMGFSQECTIFQKELEQTKKQLKVLEQQLKQLPDTSAIRLKLAYLKGNKQKAYSPQKGRSVGVLLRYQINGKSRG